MHIPGDCHLAHPLAVEVGSQRLEIWLSQEEGAEPMIDIVSGTRDVLTGVALSDLAGLGDQFAAIVAAATVPKAARVVPVPRQARRYAQARSA
jgi:hypothetical protein